MRALYLQMCLSLETLDPAPKQLAANGQLRYLLLAQTNTRVSYSPPASLRDKCAVETGEFRKLLSCTFRTARADPTGSRT
jgi:hypothetical protein